MTKPYLISSVDVLERFQYWQTAHHNMGYERDDQGNYLPNARHKGYGWEYVCEECPRLRFVDYIMEPGQAEGTARRVWHVDGDHRDDLSLEEALIRLQKPPLLSLTAFWCLLRIRAMPRGADPDVWVTGHENPKGGFIDIGTRYSKWSDARRELTAKGYITYKDGEMVQHV